MALGKAYQRSYGALSVAVENWQESEKGLPDI